MIKKETIRDCFNLLESDYGKQTNQKRELWGKMFKKYTDKQLINAVGEFLKIGKFFPRVSDIIELIEGTPADEAELALICLMDKIDNEGHYQTVSFPNYPVIGAIVERFGGWSRICNMTFGEETWFRKDFFKLYPIYKKRGDCPKELAGQFEIDNSNKYTEKFVLENYGRKLDGKKVDRKLIKGGKKEYNEDKS